MDFANKKICILGLSKSGIAAAKLLNEKGAICTISDNKAPKAEDLQTIDELKALNIEVEMRENKKETIISSDFIVTSPGIPPSADVFKLAKVKAIPVLSEIDIAYLNTDKPFLAITGTNGKTTTTKLLSEIIQKSEKNTIACGNIGLPPSSLVNNELDYFTVEISSFQAETSQYFGPFAACFINYSPDHVSWHGSEEAYFEAKSKLFLGANGAKWAVLNNNDQKVMERFDYCEENILTFGKETDKNCCYIELGIIKFKNQEGEIEEIIGIDEVSLKGKHNLENIMCAICMAKTINTPTDAIKEVLKTFKPPEHRLEFVREINGKKYYNDSKATNTDATIKALESFPNETIALIAGGRDKMTPLEDFVKVAKKTTSYIILIGEATERFRKALLKDGYKNIETASSLEEAIDIASNKDVQNILLAPACASFDMFSCFEERGTAFKDYVQQK